MHTFKGCLEASPKKFADRFYEQIHDISPVSFCEYIHGFRDTNFFIQLIIAAIACKVTIPIHQWATHLPNFAARGSTTALSSTDRFMPLAAFNFTF
jgi:hypothetical protein